MVRRLHAGLTSAPAACTEHIVAPRVAAEGAVTTAQRWRLLAPGDDTLPGYTLSRPLSADEYGRFLRHPSAFLRARRLGRYVNEGFSQ